MLHYDDPEEFLDTARRVLRICERNGRVIVSAPTGRLFLEPHGAAMVGITVSN